MPRGPLPSGNARRRNEPTIASSQLPAEGRTEKPPRCPYKLGPAGRKWWRWAWSLPQATKWDEGALYTVARRAQLEDELAALEQVEPLDLTELVTGGADFLDVAERVRWVVGQLKARAAGSTTLMREMRELDNRLGLNPKALAELRWTIAAPEEGAGEEQQAPGATVRRLRAVDPSAASA